MAKLRLKMDERNALTSYRICTVMYFLTLISLGSVLLVRQFILKQPVSFFEDIAVIVTVNIISLIGTFLFFCGFAPPKLTVVKMIFMYVSFVMAGFIFTLVKYSLFLGQTLTISQALGKLVIIAIICGILMFIWWFLGYAGHKRVERQLN